MNILLQNCIFKNALIDKGIIWLQVQESQATLARENRFWRHVEECMKLIDEKYVIQRWHHYHACPCYKMYHRIYFAVITYIFRWSKLYDDYQTLKRCYKKENGVDPESIEEWKQAAGLKRGVLIVTMVWIC